MTALIAQLSDIHVVAPGTRLGGLVDTGAAVEAAVARINATRPAVDLVLVTGDVTESGTDAESAEARRILDGLAAPYHVIPGNHDRRATLDAHFPGCGRRELEGPGGLGIVLLDSLVEEHDEGELGAEQLAWLDGVLARRTGTPTLVAVHHPPIDTGVWWMDTARLADARALETVVQAHPDVVALVCGHVHRSVSRPWAGTTAIVAPSTAFEVALDLEVEAPPRAVLDVPAYHLHAFDGRRLVTHVDHVRHQPREIELAGFFDDYEATLSEWRARSARLR